MIKYTLVCEKAHDFETWFADSAAYEVQARRGFVTCPECGSARVSKAVMAPAIARRDRPAAPRAAEPAQPPAESVAPQPMALLDAQQQALRGMMRELRRKIIEGTDDVGRRFPEEARRMHEGDIPHRAIRGEASIEDARALVEDGIEVMPVPTFPEEFN